MPQIPSPKAATGSVRTFFLTILIAATFFSSGVGAQDAVNGATVFKKCAPCHTVGAKARNKVGPVLNGVVGRPAGQVKGYKYTQVLLKSGIVWDERKLAEFVRNTNGLIKGTRMKFSGLKKDGDIADLIAYLKRFDTEGRLQ